MNTGDVRFRERLTPRAYVYVIVEALVAMVAVAYGAPFGTRVGAIVFIGASILAIWALLATSPTIEVSSTHLRAGPAVIELAHVVSASALDPAAFRLARGRDADPRRFSLLRSWHSGSGAIITIDDVDDPHPAWILTTARPVELAAALA
ncbi:MAG: hypothetical protein RL205_777 [Actinomycetota bacterium]|jgi:hypothetical protein